MGQIPPKNVGAASLKCTPRPGLKSEVTPVGEVSRCQNWKTQVSSGSAVTLPLGEGNAVRSTAIETVPAALVVRILPA